MQRMRAICAEMPDAELQMRMKKCCGRKFGPFRRVIGWHFKLFISRACKEKDKGARTCAKVQGLKEKLVRSAGDSRPLSKNNC